MIAVDTDHVTLPFDDYIFVLFLETPQDGVSVLAAATISLEVKPGDTKIRFFAL